MVCTDLHVIAQTSTQALTIVIEPDMVSTLRMVFGEDLSLLQTYGVERMILLTPDGWEYEDLGLGDAEYVVYVVRPEATWMRVIATHVQFNARRTRTWPTTAKSSAETTQPLTYLEQKSKGNDLKHSAMRSLLDTHARVRMEKVRQAQRDSPSFLRHSTTWYDDLFLLSLLHQR